jgi:hypothetical protein
MRGAEYPAEYARSTMGWPLAMGLSMAGSEAEKATGTSDPELANFTTYGKTPDAKYAANELVGSFPGGEALMQALGQGEFEHQGDISGAIRGQTGFGISQGPYPKQIVAQRHIQEQQQVIDNLRSRGATAAANHLQKRLDAYKKYHRLYVP